MSWRTQAAIYIGCDAADNMRLFDLNIPRESIQFITRSYSINMSFQKSNTEVGKSRPATCFRPDDISHRSSFCPQSRRRSSRMRPSPTLPSPVRPLLARSSSTSSTQGRRSHVELTSIVTIAASPLPPVKVRSTSSNRRSSPSPARPSATRRLTRWIPLRAR
jgi:hypothetical protein